ncbi:hypothetical protein D9M68_656080 [compost metagenome]
MRHQFVELAEPGGTERMALRFQAARGVDRDSPTQGEFATFSRRPALAKRDQAEVLDLNDLAHRRGVMDFGDMHVLWSQARLLIGQVSCQASDVQFRLVEPAVAEATDHAGRYLDAAAPVGTDARESFLGAEDGRRRTVRQRRAHRQGERVGDRRRGQDFVDVEGFAKLRVGVMHRVGVVFRRHRGDLPLRGAVGFHMVAA